MRRNSVLLSQESAAHREQILAAIGRRLKEECGSPQALPDRLADLVRKFEQSTGKSQSERDPQ